MKLKVSVVKMERADRDDCDDDECLIYRKICLYVFMSFMMVVVMVMMMLMVYFVCNDRCVDSDKHQITPDQGQGKGRATRTEITYRGHCCEYPYIQTDALV